MLSTIAALHPPFALLVQLLEFRHSFRIDNLLVQQAELLGKPEQAPQAVEILRKSRVCHSVAGDRLLIVRRAYVASGHHEQPLDFARLNGGRLLQIMNGLLVGLCLDVVCGQALQRRNVGWILAIRLADGGQMTEERRKY